MQGIFMVVDECFLDFVKDPEKHTLKGKLEKYTQMMEQVKERLEALKAGR